ncbi:MAG: N-acetylglucosamine-6-phosphate deacetylase [Firmicutes bacterium]|nr:N-acetylglucosamine-6-phosphate deacetylase [Bacillota bacterium]
MTDLLITNGKVITPEGILVGGAIRISEGVITEVQQEGEVSAEGAEVLDAEGGYIAPGLIDMHIHGSQGLDVMDGKPESLIKLAQYLAITGTTVFVPTTMTASSDKLHKVAQATSEAIRRLRPECAEIIGLHLEGPFVNPAKQGAQDPESIRPFNLEEVQRLQEAAQGLIKRITFAPELVDLSLVPRLLELGVAPSVGHSAADYATVKKAVSAGCRQVTHLYNGMSGLNHHNPGVAAAALDISDLTVEVIADGVHVHPALLRLAFTAKGPDKMVLITDAHLAAGLPVGDYPRYGVKVTKDAVYLSNGVLAGSKISLLEAVKFMVNIVGVSLVDAFRMASLSPAKALGIWERKGSIEAGKDADILICDAQLRLKHVLIRGNVLF